MIAQLTTARSLSNNALLKLLLLLGCLIGLTAGAVWGQQTRVQPKSANAYRTSYERLFCGGRNSFEIRAGILWAWGGNSHGQLGDGTRVSRITPVQIGTATNWVSIANEIYHSVGLRSDGTLWSWGANSHGQLGNGTTTSSNSPIRVGTATNWVSVAVGSLHTLALKSDGTLWAWGFNNNGQLGNGTTTNASSPVQMGSATNWVSMAAGNNYSLGLKSDGTLWAWGFNPSGQLGNGTTTNASSPVQVGTATNWVSIDAGYAHSTGIRSDGTLWAWGENSSGQLGDGSTTTRSVPGQVGTATNWVSVAAGYAHVLAVKSDGSLWAWGYNNFSQLGDNSTTSRSVPGQVGTATNWVSLDAGSYHSLALRSDGTLFGWGSNTEGQLGDGTTTSRPVPTSISTITPHWISTVAGAFHSLGLKSTGTLWAWGNNANGQLGNGSTTNASSAVQVGSATNWVAGAGGGGHSLGLRTDGTLWAWGFNAYGQLGDGSTLDRTTPVQVSSATNWVSMATGNGHSLGLRSDGTLWAWGGNPYGQLGDGTTSFRSAPVQIGTATNWVSVAAGYDHSLALKSDGTLWAWGLNTSGQLGNSTTTNALSPVQVGSATNWVAMSAGPTHSLGLRSNGTLWAWGNNTYGQLGDGTTTNYVSPVQVGTTTNWIGATASDKFSLGLRTDGQLWAWGFNAYGELGTGNTVNQQNLVAINGVGSVVGLHTGGTANHALVVDATRQTICATGYNTSGQLGNGTTALILWYGCSLFASGPTITGFAATSTTLCTGQPAMFTATVGNVWGNFSYTLTSAGSVVSGTGGGTPVFTLPVTPQGTGLQTYTLRVSSSGLSGSATATVPVNPVPDITYSGYPSLTVLTGTTLTLTLSGGDSYSWDGGTPGAFLTSTPTLDGIYSISYRGTKAGCTTPFLNAEYFAIYPAPGPVIYVTQNGAAGGWGDGSSWSNALSGNLLHLGIDMAALSNAQVWMGAGVYKPINPASPATPDRNASFALRNGVAIFGGFVGTETSLASRTLTFPSSTTLSGDIGNPAIGTPTSTTENCYHVISNPAGLTASAVLDGVVITGGNANGSNNNGMGGGVLNAGGGYGKVCSPTFRNCLFVANAASLGGGMYNLGSAEGRSSPTLTNCVLMANTATTAGGAIYNDALLSGRSSPILTNTCILFNTAPGGGAMLSRGTSGGQSSPTLTNCVVFGNGGASTFQNANAGVTAIYSLFENTVQDYTGTATLTTATNPFVSTVSAQLATGSPAINAGDPSVTTAIVGNTDAGGNARVQAGRIDMGALEFGGTTCSSASVVNSLKAGNWSDPTVWSCGAVPTALNVVEVRHTVSVPTAYTAQLRQLNYGAGGKLTPQTGAKLRLGF